CAFIYYFSINTCHPKERAVLVKYKPRLLGWSGFPFVKSRHDEYAARCSYGLGEHIPIGWLLGPWLQYSLRTHDVQSLFEWRFFPWWYEPPFYLLHLGRCGIHDHMHLIGRGSIEIVRRQTVQSALANNIAK